MPNFIDQDVPAAFVRFSVPEPDTDPAPRAHTSGPSGPCAGEARDAPTWTAAGQAWRRWQHEHFAGAPSHARVARVALVNAVVAAVRRHERGITSDESLAAALHNAVKDYHRRVA